MDPTKSTILSVCVDDLEELIDSLEGGGEDTVGDRCASSLTHLKALQARLDEFRADRDGQLPFSRLEKMQVTSLEELNNLRGDFDRLGRAMTRIRPTLKRVDDLGRQVLSLAEVTVGAAKRLQKTMKTVGVLPSAGQITEEFTKVQRVINRIDRSLEELAQKQADFEERLASSDPVVGGGVGGDGQMRSIERRFGMIEAKLELILSKQREAEKSSGADSEALDRLRDSLDQQRKGGVGADSGAAQAELGHGDIGERLGAFERKLSAIYDRQSAIESLSMILHPLTKSLEDASLAAARTADLGKKVDGFSASLEELTSLVRRLK